ncbi:MAG: hypothetical protein K2N05_06740 [Muribaculaceae bacterium]|nr:hypothetical protein [Muribaculaceae bacterium]
MNIDILQWKVESMIELLKDQIERLVPEDGDFPMIYSEFKNTDPDFCLTDILLMIRPLPAHLENHERYRWLELSGYKLPVPYKSTRIIFQGTTKEVIEFLNRKEAVEKILQAIPDLNYNMLDV